LVASKIKKVEMKKEAHEVEVDFATFEIKEEVEIVI
jgi:hypothetical protein